MLYIIIWVMKMTKILELVQNEKDRIADELKECSETIAETDMKMQRIHTLF